MRRLIMVALMLSVAGTASAANTSNKLSDQPPKIDRGDRATSPRTGGDTIATATVIPTPLPQAGYMDTAQPAASSTLRRDLPLHRLNLARRGLLLHSGRQLPDDH